MCFRIPESRCSGSNRLQIINDFTVSTTTTFTVLSSRRFFFQNYFPDNACGSKIVPATLRSRRRYGRSTATRMSGDQRARYTIGRSKPFSCRSRSPVSRVVNVWGHNIKPGQNIEYNIISRVYTTLIIHMNILENITNTISIIPQIEQLDGV